MSETTPPRIGYVLKMYPRFSETFVANEVLELERRGLNIHIFSLKKPNVGRFHAMFARVNAEVTYLSVPSIIPLLKVQWRLLLRFRSRYVSTLARALLRRKRSSLTRFIQAGLVVNELEEAGIVHLHAHFASTATRVAMLAHSMSGIPYSFTAHAKDIYVNGVDPENLRTKIEHSDFVITVSDFNKRHISSLCGDGAADKVHRVYNGIDLGFFRPDLRVKREEALILGVGRLVEKKGFVYLIEACRILKTRGVSFRCEIVGDGPESPALWELILHHELADRVFLAGGERHSEVLARMRRATVFALPCVVAKDGNRDGLPTVLLEAMAVGLPVVSTDLTGIPEIIEHEKTGLMVRSQDAKLLAEALERLLADPGLRARLATAARRKVERDFEVGGNAGKVQALFEQGLGKRGISLRSPDQVSAPFSAPEGGKDLRILYVSCDTGIPLLGSKGSSVHIREFTRALKNLGNQLELVVARLGEGEEFDPRIPVYEPAPSEMALRIAAKLKADSSSGTLPAEFYGLQMNQPMRSAIQERLKAQRWDVIYERYSLWSYEGAQLAQEWGIPFVLEVNSPLPEEQELHRGMTLSHVARGIELELMSAADGIITVSSQLREHVIERGASPERTFVIANGVDPERFNPAVDGGSVRRDLNIDGDEFVVGFLGSIRAWHGVDVLLRVFRDLSSEGHRRRLLVVGDGPLMNWIKEFTIENRLEEKVVLTGRVGYNLIPGYLAAMDVAVAPYPAINDFYFSPIKVFEYAAMAKPIVASSQGQLSEVFKHMKTALLYAPGDARGLRECLILLEENEGLRLELGSNARTMIVEHHSWEAKARRAEEIVEMLKENDNARLHRLLGHSVDPADQRAAGG